jgi:hypothetical protein
MQFRYTRHIPLYKQNLASPSQAQSPLNHALHISKHVSGAYNYNSKGYPKTKITILKHTRQATYIQCYTEAHSQIIVAMEKQ